jgi:hypothetical protein
MAWLRFRNGPSADNGPRLSFAAGSAGGKSWDYLGCAIGLILRLLRK